jgi:predicted transcriptional regulator
MISDSSVSWRTSRRGLSFSAIGRLEAEILAAVWEREPAAACVRDLYEELRAKRSIAYTTVMTVMSNLAKKGLLACDASSIAYLYRAAIPAEEVAGEVLESLVALLYRGRTEAAATRLLGLESALSEAQLEELRRYARTLLAG